MVNYTDPSRPKPSEKVLQLLYQSGLMHSESVPPFPSFSSALSGGTFSTHYDGMTFRDSTRSLRSMRITSKGFQFLLEDVNTQLWDLLLTYLESSEVSSTRHHFFFLPFFQSYLSILRKLIEISRGTNRIWSIPLGFCSCWVHSNWEG